MRVSDETTRQRIREALRSEPATPSSLAATFDLTPDAALGHVEHVARSVDGADDDEQVLVAPPTCTSCGFDDFDDLLNRPSRCPHCRGESVSEPTITIE
ncbi:transcriptional regulator [Natronobiforma cellulositropha]|uniref:transcriptional regulator n=1 Tax=Natronobiforma cellulositropha TaxID=1679076 RepID=UPI0021D5B688|nr:transcriptional regulator [Natronobiforma cellulositropha]